jgi:hypothetical protein
METTGTMFLDLIPNTKVEWVEVLYPENLGSRHLQQEVAPLVVREEYSELRAPVLGFVESLTDEEKSAAMREQYLPPKPIVEIANPRMQLVVDGERKQILAVHEDKTHKVVLKPKTWIEIAMYLAKHDKQQALEVDLNFCKEELLRLPFPEMLAACRRARMFFPTLDRLTNKLQSPNLDMSDFSRFSLPVVELKYDILGPSNPDAIMGFQAANPYARRVSFDEAEIILIVLSDGSYSEMGISPESGVSELRKAFSNKKKVLARLSIQCSIDFTVTDYVKNKIHNAELVVYGHKTKGISPNFQHLCEDHIKLATVANIARNELMVMGVLNFDYSEKHDDFNTGVKPTSKVTVNTPKPPPRFGTSHKNRQADWMRACMNPNQQVEINYEKLDHIPKTAFCFAQMEPGPDPALQFSSITVALKQQGRFPVFIEEIGWCAC